MAIKANISNTSKLCVTDNENPKELLKKRNSLTIY